MDRRYRLQGSTIDFEFRPTGGPIDDPFPNRKLFAAIGKASAAWARMELMLDIILLHINKESEAAAIYDPRYPRFFKQKLKLMKRWLRHLKLAADEATFRQTLAILKELANTRNDVLHSCITSYDRATERFNYISIRFLGDDRFEVKERAFFVEGLNQLYVMANKATLALTEVADLVMPHGGD
jgi:hypothetical protein